MCGSDVFLGIIAILFPPLAVWVKRGICSADSLINIALCMLGFLPGLFHAWYIIFNYPDTTYDELPQRDPEGAPQNGHNNVTYYYVQHPQPQQQPGGSAQGARPQQQQGYGTVGGPSAGAKGSGSGEGDDEVPPSYSQAVKGDHKVQGP